MSSKQRSRMGNVLFWLLLIGASAAAFGGGFWYTYGATVNVSTKAPGDELTKADERLMASPRADQATIAASPAAQASATAAPGPLPVGSQPPTNSNGQPGVVAPPADQATPTPMAPAANQQPVQQTQATTVPVQQALASPQAEIYRVQVGPFDSRDDAQKKVEELQTAGINAVVVFDDGRYQAQLGAFSDRARAISVADEVNTRGYSVTIRH